MHCGWARTEMHNLWQFDSVKPSKWIYFSIHSFVLVGLVDSGSDIVTDIHQAFLEILSDGYPWN